MSSSQQRQPQQSALAQQQYLAEMGIDQWSMACPERLGLTQETELCSLPEECRLVLVSPVAPCERESLFLSKVAPTLGVELSHCFYLAPHQLSGFDTRCLKWVWFAGCEQQECDAEQPLCSPCLAEVDGNIENKRALWQQIKAYGN